MKFLIALSAITWLCQHASAQEREIFSLSEEAPSETQDATTMGSPAAAEPVARRTQWLMFTADWCQPCAAAKADFVDWLRRSRWIVDDTEAAHVRLIDGDELPEMVRRYQITQYPAFVLLRDGDVRFRQLGYPGREALVTRYQQAVASSAPVVGAISVGTWKGQQDNIRQVIAALRPILEDGGTLTLRLDRRQSRSAILALGDAVSVRLDDPLVMNFVQHNEHLICRFDEPLPRVRLSLGVPLEQSVSAVALSVSEVVLELPRAPNIKLRVEP